MNLLKSILYYSLLGVIAVMPYQLSVSPTAAIVTAELHCRCSETAGGCPSVDACCCAAQSQAQSVQSCHDFGVSQGLSATLLTTPKCLVFPSLQAPLSVQLFQLASYSPHRVLLHSRIDRPPPA